MSGSALAGAAASGGDALYGHGPGVLERVQDAVAEQPVGDRSVSRRQEIGRGGGHAAKKNYRAYQRGLSKEQAKRVRSLMHDFRRRPEDLKPEARQALDDLFDKVPVLGQIYHLRWQATTIFDTAPNRTTAATQLREW